MRLYERCGFERIAALDKKLPWGTNTHARTHARHAHKHARAHARAHARTHMQG